MVVFNSYYIFHQEVWISCSSTKSNNWNHSNVRCIFSVKYTDSSKTVLITIRNSHPVSSYIFFFVPYNYINTVTSLYFFVQFAHKNKFQDILNENVSRFLMINVVNNSFGYKSFPNLKGNKFYLRSYFMPYFD